MSAQDPYIWTKEKTLSRKFCKDLITKFNSNSQLNSHGLTVNGEASHIKKSIDCYLSGYDIYKEEDKVFFNSLSSALTEYEQVVSKRVDTWHMTNNFVKCDFSSGLPTRDTGYQMQKTNPGDFYDWHHDWMYHHGGVRTLTYIWYLNTVTQGGYTEFFNGIKVQPVTGKLLIFPATWTYMHRGFPPKTQSKYIVTGWLLNQLT